MRPTFQVANNDCLSACVASIFEKPLKEVPVFANHKTEWYKQLAKYCENNLKCFCFHTKFVPYKHWYYIMIMDWYEKEIGNKHALVGYKGAVVHDPSKTRTTTDPFSIDYYIGFGALE